MTALAKRVLYIVLFVCMATIRMLGVGTTGTIVGTVRDHSGATVANAQVAVRNQETNAARRVQTNETGDYSVPLLPPGTYEVVIENRGFRRAVFKDIALAVDQTVRVDVTLQLGEVNQQVTVESAAPLVQTDTSTIGQVIEGNQVKTLPLNERNFVAFALLVPGAQLPSEGSLDSTQGQALSVNGARETANNFLLDGVDNQDLVINQYSVLPMTDAIEQFKVQSSTYSAEFGRSGGAQINVVLLCTRRFSLTGGRCFTFHWAWTSRLDGLVLSSVVTMGLRWFLPAELACCSSSPVPTERVWRKSLPMAANS